MTALPLDRYVDINGLRLHYLEWPGGGAETVVLVHGINVQAHTWDPIAAELAEGRRVIAVDLRGHGQSQWAESGYSLSSFVADLAGLLDALGLETIELLGHSLGARVAIGFAGEYPDRVSALVLSDTGPEVASGGTAFSRAIVTSTQDVRGFRNRAEVRAHYEALHPEWKPVFLDLHAEYQVRENWAGKLVFRSDPELFWITGSAGRRENPYLWSMCGQVTAPVLIMWATHSEFLDQDIASRMLEAFPDAELCRIEAGHYIPREAPSEFIAAVQAFFYRKASA